MQLTETKLREIIASTVQETIKALNLEVSTPKPKLEFSERSAYQKTEQLLYMYNKFKSKIVEAEQTILEYKLHGVPQRGSSMGERVQTSRTNVGIVLPEESLEQAIHSVERSVQDIVQVVTMIEKGLEQLQYDPYYPILKMLYFEGRTQEDIAVELHTTQKTISKHKTRMVRELALEMFPDQVVTELLSK